MSHASNICVKAHVIWRSEQSNHTVMLNPFVNLHSTEVERELKRRHRVKVCLYSCLMATFLLGMGLLIQGCRVEQKSGSTFARPPANGLGNQTSRLEIAQANLRAEVFAQPATVATALPSGVRAAEKTVLDASSLVADISVSASKGYVVKSGDTLSAIAKAHGTTVKALRAANGLPNDHILVGKELKLPGNS